MPANKLFDFVVQNKIDHEVIDIDSDASPYDVGVIENNVHCERITPTLLRIGEKYVNAIFSANHVIDLNEIKKNLGRESITRLDSFESTHGFEHEFLVDDRLLRPNGRLAVRLDDSGKLLKIDCNDFARIARPTTLRMPAAPAYKAKLGYVSPKASQKLLPDIENCFLGVSLENSNFIRPKLLSMIEWISNRFENCTVLVGDSIHRITLAANGVPAEHALARALTLGDEFIEREKNCFSAFSDRCNFTFQRCSDIQRENRYAEIHAELLDLFQTSDVFRDSIEKFAGSYHQKLREALTDEQWQHRLASSRDYFLEEFAIIGLLQERGWPALVYPGSFSTLADIAEGRISGAPQSLKSLLFACLHIKKR